MDLKSLWPQDNICTDCLVAISMDASAPFLADMGLLPEIMGPLRSVIRGKVNQEREYLGRGVNLPWLESLDALFRRHVPGFGREHFWMWVRDTFTWAPADRRNWSLYEHFLSRWSAGMRTGDDNARCFKDAGHVYQIYYSFVSSRGLDERIRHAKREPLSVWDQTMFSLRPYSFRDGELEDGEHIDPLGLVKSTSEMNYFQQFWEFLYPGLTKDERQDLYDATLGYYHGTGFFTDLVSPDNLTRSMR